jgi:hypothetical protein
MSDSMERHIALREAHCSSIKQSYFKARPELLRAGINATFVFSAAFNRGFDAARDEYAHATPPEAKAAMLVALKALRETIDCEPCLSGDTEIEILNAIDSLRAALISPA